MKNGHTNSTCRKVKNKNLKRKYNEKQTTYFFIDSCTK